jgi:hypothetical protein
LHEKTCTKAARRLSLFWGKRGAGEAGEAFFPRGIFFKLDKHEQDVLNCKTSLLSGHQERIKRF